jgi:hypothetical protein
MAFCHLGSLAARKEGAVQRRARNEARASHLGSAVVDKQPSPPEPAVAVAAAAVAAAMAAAALLAAPTVLLVA